jgi:hypothetical protein
MKRSHNELYNLWRGDYLYCTACGHSIFWIPYHGTVYFRQITAAYNDHLKACFALKRAIVTQRKLLIKTI